MPRFGAILILGLLLETADSQSIRSINAVVFNVGRNHTTIPFPTSTTPFPAGPDGQVCWDSKPCKPGLLLPIWEPQIGISMGTRLFRAFVYFVALAYLFYGVSIVSDRFMAAIEVITSQEKAVKIKKPNGQETHVLVRVWNETVSNLTLMALGSSAPEILLSVIEIFGNGFEAGDLGPSTIVGSAAFNLFIIIVVCILAVPSDEIRKVHRIDVFWVTVAWSTFAYIWLFAIISVFSPGVIEIWEAVVTFLCFPLTVITAFICNKHAHSMGQRFLKGNITTFVRNRPSRLATADKTNGLVNGSDVEKALLGSSTNDADVVAFEDHRKQYLEMFRRLRSENPDLSIEELERLATESVVNAQPKSRAFYRIQATHKMMGAGDLTKKLRKKSNEPDAPPFLPQKPKMVTVEFDPVSYMCLENIGDVEVKVRVDRGSFSVPIVVLVDYYTVADTAQEFEDFMPIKGSLRFEPGETVKTLSIPIVDNDVYEDDEQFYVQLRNVRAQFESNEDQKVPSKIKTTTATVLIVDDDHGGAFSFESEVFKVAENAGVLILEVKRHRGARGAVSVPFRTIDGAAKDGKDYIGQVGELRFQDGQTKAEIEIEIINDDEYEKTEDFYVELEAPIWHAKNQDGQDGADGRPILGAHTRCKVLITEDKEFKSFVDKMLTNANTLAMVGSSSWEQQFADAMEVEDLDGDGSLSKREVILHYLSLPWKLLFALIPPTDYFNGWFCFLVSIVAIGILTAFIGDVASMFGCTIGLKDSITAISLVAMGTSLPDTFASVTSAKMDKTADSSIGNVTGSNAVNVFLGIGIAWLCAAVYHASKGTVFRVEAGALASSVTLFLIGSLICFLALQWRRHHAQVRGELGGPTKHKYISFIIFVGCWLAYLVFSTLVAYCVIPGF
ncbi:unnamed protein product [Bursaphelenchus xylophilus]|uniref:(pine wood nematode) hypothetical protein n=1 Tax=Bursaphelenchus xylophilus TaxID=6326 RepID=A0A1I7SAN4_BURXY|nr:unnamed protein product [Bursaphelenchus xylophilus]CAG9126953.1 unnamed protein product [Bursaphelenchus xylophilus]